jgi:hypothetical protein
MSHRLNITISTEQYEYLDSEADRSSVSIAELVRRAIDTVFGPQSERRVIQITHSTGRRPGRHIQ